MKMYMFKLTNKAGFSATYIAGNADRAIEIAVKNGHARKAENLKYSPMIQLNPSQDELLDACGAREVEGCLITQMVGGVSTPVVNGTAITECAKSLNPTPASSASDLLSILKGSMAR